jgi:hypothetical protein
LKGPHPLAPLRAGDGAVAHRTICVERDELAAWLRLTLTPGVGNATVRKLLAAFGLPQACVRAI